LKIGFPFLKYTKLSKAKCFAHCELAPLYCKGERFVDHSKISRHTRFSFQFVKYKSNDKPTVTLHQIIPVAGKRVDFGTATRKNLYNYYHRYPLPWKCNAAWL